MDPITAVTLIGSAASIVALFDKWAAQFLPFATTGSAQPQEKPPWGSEIRRQGDDLVVTRQGQVLQTIRAQDLSGLPEASVRHVQTLEKSMEAHYARWSDVYPMLARERNNERREELGRELRGIVGDMRNDLLAILGFLESIGIHLDDHYTHIRHVVDRR